MANRGVKAYVTFNVPITDIKIEKARQREDLGDLEGLAKSIRNRGQLTPIILRKGDFLVAGERRIRAIELLKSPTIVARYFEDMSPMEQQLIEWDENFHRLDLDWKEKAKTVVRIHEGNQAISDDWTVEKTADSLGVSQRFVTQHLLVGRSLDTHDPQLLACTSFSAAYNVMERKAQRDRDHAVNKFFADQAEPEPEQETSSFTIVASPPVPSVDNSVICEDFHEWAAAYSGRPFDFIHLDPPYGLNHNESAAGGADRHGAYSDKPDDFFRFIQTIANYRSKLLMEKAHVMVWFSMKYYEALTKLVVSRFDSKELRLVPFPLIWHKSDATGMVPDASREPKRIYETALMFSLGDRRVVKPVSNLNSLPATKRSATHLSEKPWPMLAHFFQLFIDDHTRFLDPCVGSGSSLAAATHHKAKFIFGMDIEPNYVEAARIALQRARLNAEGIFAGSEYNKLQDEQEKLLEEADDEG